MAVCTITISLVDNFTYYWEHRLFHRVPFLWEFHKIHHSAEVMTPFTVLRKHPIEHLARYLRAGFTAAVTIGVIEFLFIDRFTMAMVLGFSVVMLAYHIIGLSNLRHSHIWLSYGPSIEKWFMSPAQHQIHHSNDPKHFGKNFGSYLSIWDRLYGTLYVTDKSPEPIEFGIEEKHRDLKSMYLNPFK